MSERTVQTGGEPLRDEREVGGQYRIETRVATTQTGEIFVGRDLKAGNARVYLKRYYPERALPTSEDHRAQEQEIRLLQMLPSLGQPLLVKVQRWFYHGDSLFGVLERVEGSLLPRVVGEPRLHTNLSRIARWGLQLCQLIDACRGRRSPRLVPLLNPGSIAVTADGELKVLLFGLERTLGGTSTSPSMTAVEEPEEGGLFWEDTEVKALAKFLLFLMTAGTLDEDTEKPAVSLNAVAAPVECGPLLRACLEAFEGRPAQEFSYIRRELRKLVGEEGEVDEEMELSPIRRTLIGVNVRAQQFSLVDIAEEALAIMRVSLVKFVQEFFRFRKSFAHRVQETREQLFEGIPPERLVFFTRQLEMAVHAGISLHHTIGLLMREEDNPYFKKVLEKVQKLVMEGRPPSAAFATFPRIFPVVFVKLLAAGESAGVMGEVLSKLADFQEKALTIRKTIQAALFYPVMLTIFAVVATCFLFGFMIPQLFALFSGLNAQLPLPARVLVYISNMLLNPIFQGAAAMAVAVVWAFLRTSARTNMGKQYVDTLKFTLPIVKPLTQRVVFTHYLRTTGLLYGFGMPLIQAFRLADAVCDNMYLSSELTAPLVMGIAKGETPTDILKAAPIVPPLVRAVLAVGIETGDVPTLLQKTADLYEEELFFQLNELSKKVEPLVILFLGGLVLFILLATYLPLYSLLSNLM